MQTRAQAAPLNVFMEPKVITVKLKDPLEFTIDDEDSWILEQYNFTATKRGAKWYVRLQKSGPGCARQPKLYLHRLICCTSNGQDVDHIDGNGLNNTRANLRPASRSQNNLNRGKLPSNTSGFKRVFFNRDRGKWFAKIKVDCKEHKRGYFTSPEAAAEAYDQLAKQWSPQFALTNENSRKSG